MSTTHGRRLSALVAAALLSVPGTTVAADAMPAATEVSSDGLYVVSLSTPPTWASRSTMVSDQDAVLEQIGEPEVVYRYTAALNGFAAELTREQVKTLRAIPEVDLVERSTLQRLDTVDSPGFIGAQEAWAAAGGPEEAGSGTVIGIVDSGIWPENPTFAALPSQPPEDFRGECETGEQWEASDCNSKVVAARYFVEGFGEENIAASEFLSPRDGTGHGSHVAAVAAGNHGVRVEVDGQQFGYGSGMAPAARVAAYKACWTAPDPADDGCATADTVAAIDQAVADGVDVINYAVSGPATGEADSVELAFLNATAAGVFVATSAGNSGPRASTVAHTSPWVTTVAASTHRMFQGAVVVPDTPRWLVGAMISDQAVPRTGIVLAEDTAVPGTGAQEARLCRPGSLDASLVRGRIVVCDRGIIPRVEKSSAVAQAGGVAMVLANVHPDSVDPDFHAVPTVHLDVAAADTLKRYIRQAEDPTALIDPNASDTTPVPQVAAFSARGPVPGQPDLLKPDLTAPGVGVLSAVAPPSNNGRLWGQMSGTSMSAAHVAGLAALVAAERPDWSPAMVKSALSTTAGDLAGVSDPRSNGAGQVDASRVLDPGLVLNAPPRRYRAWLEGSVPTRNLNLPSIAVGDLTGRARVVRRLTNVSESTETYTVDRTGLDGLGVTVRPSTLTLAPGETGRFVVRLDRAGAVLETPVSGHLYWRSRSHRVRIPVEVVPRTLSAPVEATGTGRQGALSYQGVAGFDGSLDLRVTGMAGAAPVGLTLEPGDFDPQAPEAGTATALFPIEVPSNAAALRLELEGRDTDDMDLYLYQDGELLASATGATADEILTEVDPRAGDHELYVTSVAAANGSTTTAQLYVWVVNDGDAGNLQLERTVPVAAGEPFQVDLSWQGLDPTRRWFGTVHYAGSDRRTFVTLN